VASSIALSTGRMVLRKDKVEIGDSGLYTSIPISACGFNFWDLVYSQRKTWSPSSLFSNAGQSSMAREVMESGLHVSASSPARQKFVRERVGRVSHRKSRFGGIP